MIAWLMRRRCLWCAKSAIGMCWSHKQQAFHWWHRWQVVAMVVGAALAIAAGFYARGYTTVGVCR